MEMKTGDIDSFGVGRTPETDRGTAECALLEYGLLLGRPFEWLIKTTIQAYIRYQAPEDGVYST